MGTITSGTGLISGLDIESLVTQLMAIESKPKTLLEDRVEALTEKQTALTTLQAQILALQVSMASFNKESVFQQKSVTSSLESVITATATKYAEVGNYQFRVKQLASNHQFVSRGYSSLNSSIGTGTLSFEIGQGQVSKATELSFLNGQQGFQRGTLSITDRAGNSAKIDLSTAQTMQDVIDTINANGSAKVTAAVSGDHLVITDLSGGTGNLQISGTPAESLGIAASVAGASLTGEKIFYMTEDTLLKSLNDGNGIRGLNSGDDIKFTLKDGTEIEVDLRSTLREIVGGEDSSNKLKSLNSGQGVRLGTFRITDQNGTSVDIDLTELGEDATLRQVREKIETEAAAKGMNITVAFNSLDHLTITDNSTASGSGDRASHFIIEDLDGGSAAADLGIVDDIAGSNIYGEQIWKMETVGDVMNAINNHWANEGGVLNVSINDAGNGLQITDSSALSGSLIISEMYSSAAEDLGILTAETGVSDPVFSGQRLIGGMNTVLMRSLQGGNGGDGTNRITDGTIQITDRSGASAQISVSANDTLQEVLDKINEAGIQVDASVNTTGNGILLSDSSGGTGNLVIADVSGDVAEKLGIAGDQAVGSIDSGNLQLQYISGATLLADLRQGQGMAAGKITVTDGKGSSAVIDLSQSDTKTVEDVIRKFELSGTNVRARINDTGDGLLLYDVSEGEGLAAIKVAEKGSTTASDLRILGTGQTAEDGKYYIDGSYEFTLDVGGGDDIEDIVSYVNNAGLGLKASIVNDGSGSNPYRISFTSEISGRSGTVYLDAGQTNMTVTDLSQARDAIVLIGEGSEESSLMITSSSNTIENSIKGVTLDLVGTSDEPVTVSVSEDLEAIVTQIESFVSTFNTVMTTIESLDSYNTDTQEQSVLFNEYSVESARRSLVNMVQRTMTDASGSFKRLSQIGIKFTSMTYESGTDESGKTVNYAVAKVPQLEFDEEAFREAYDEDPEGVTELFTKTDTGFGDYIEDQLESLASTSSTSTIKNRLTAMQSSQKLLEDRISYLDVLLEKKETRLYNEFYAMEEALAAMQTQQTALSSLKKSS